MSQDDKDMLELAIDPARERKARSSGTLDLTGDPEEATFVGVPLVAQGSPEPAGAPGPRPGMPAGPPPAVQAGAGRAGARAGQREGWGTAVQSFHISEVLSQSMSVYIQRLIPLSLITLVVYVLPAVGLQMLILRTVGGSAPAIEQTFDEAGMMTGAQTSPLSVEVFVWGVVAALVLMASGLFVCAVVTGTTFRQMRGEPAGLGEMIRMGLGRVWRLLGMGAILYLATLGFVICFVLLSIVLGFLVTLLGVGALVLIVVLCCRWWVLLPVVVVEPVPLMQSFGRSAFLSEGNRVRIFGLAVLLWGVGIAIGLLFKDASDTFGLVLGALFQMAYGNFFLVVLAVCYHELRMAKEDLDLGELVRVFS